MSGAKKSSGAQNRKRKGGLAKENEIQAKKFKIFFKAAQKPVGEYYCDLFEKSIKSKYFGLSS